MRNPNPKNTQDFLVPLVIKNATAKDGGNYTCLLEVLLRKVKEHNVSDSSIIRSEFPCSLPIYLIKEAGGRNRRRVPQIRKKRTRLFHKFFDRKLAIVRAIQK